MRRRWIGGAIAVGLGLFGPAHAQAPTKSYVATVRPLRADPGPMDRGFDIGNIAVRRFAPVIYTGTEGGGPNEYRVTPNGVEITFQIDDPPENGEMVDVRYEPYDNVGALTAFAMLRVERVDRNHVRLSARSYRDTPNRMRLLITATYGAA